MKKTFILLLTFISIFAISRCAFAKAIPPEPGTLQSHVSHNGKFTVEIRIIGYPDSSPSDCTFKEGNQVIWSKQIPTTPGQVKISDNGEIIAMVNWGWYDEMGSKSLSFYDKKGDLIKEVSFGGDEFGMSPMKWVRNLTLSPDGTYCMVGSNGEEKALFSLYESKTGKLVWEKAFGYEETVEIKISDAAKFILVATSNYKSGGNMWFLLLNRDGGILWQKKISKNHSWDVEEYLRFKDNGKEFEIFNLVKNKFIFFALPADKGGKK